MEKKSEIYRGEVITQTLPQGTRVRTWQLTARPLVICIEHQTVTLSRRSAEVKLKFARTIRRYFSTIQFSPSPPRPASTQLQKNPIYISDVPGPASSPRPGQARPQKARPGQAKALVRPTSLARLEISKAQAKPSSPGLLVIN